MAKTNIPKDTKDLPLAIVKQMITLSTSGFGLVAALAWNEVVKAFMEGYIKPFLPQSSQMLTLFLYATIVTILAVLVTLQLTRLQQQLETIKEKLASRRQPQA